MTIKSIDDKNKWEDFLKQCQQKTFLDSWNWGEFQKKLKRQIWRVGVFADKELVGVAQVIKIEARRGTFLFVPHGPVLEEDKLQSSSEKSKILKNLLEKLKQIGEQEQATFIRINPIWGRSEANNEIFDKLNFKQASLFKHPELTWELDITLPERGLLKNMRKSTRRSIRHAKKEGVEVFTSKDPADLAKFYRLYEKVVERKDFVPFSKKFIKKEFSTFLEDDQILAIFSRYKDEVLSSAIIVYWQNKAFYHHGASDLKYDVPISYPVQWKAIKEAKERDCDVYNFWGVAPEDATEDHPWHGLTLFKTGFGGERKKYVKTRDFPLSATYWATYWFEKLRRSNRNL